MKYSSGISHLRVHLWVMVLLAFCLTVGASSVLGARELTLNQALSTAFANSPTMKRVGYSLEMSRHNLQAQQASLKSQFSLTVTPYQYSKSQTYREDVGEYLPVTSQSSSLQFSIDQPIKWTDGTLSFTNSMSWEERQQSLSIASTKIDATTINYSSILRASYSQPIFTYNRTQLDLKELELSLEKAQLNFDINKLAIEQQVTSSFLSLFYQKSSVEIGQEELTNATESYDIIKSKVDAGISALEELYQADLSMANSQASLENRQIQYENALDNFKIMLGMDLEEDLSVNANVEKMIADVNLAQAINQGLANRMELRQRDIEIQNAIHSLTRTGAQNEFWGMLNVSYGLQGVDSTFGKMYDSPTKNQTFDVTFNIPLFDWGKKKHQIKSAETQVESSRLNADEERKQIKYEIRQSYRKLQNQKLQIDIAEKNVKNARLTYEINLEKYKNGDLTSKDLSFYQDQLSTERLNEVSALIDYQLALLELKIRALYDFQTNQPVVTRNQEN